MGKQPTFAAASHGEMKIVNSSLMLKVFLAFVALGAMSVAISAGGRWFGRSIAMAGYTDATTPHEVVIGNNVLSVPANTIRFEQARQNGVAPRLDLYLHWPELGGYNEAAQADFNHVGGSKRILFLSLEGQIMSQDMSGRFAAIYSALIVKPGAPGPNGTTLYGFEPASGYINELLVVAERSGKPPFVARCLSGASAEESLAPCERDVLIGTELSLTYRFPRELLGEWRTLDESVTAKVAGFLKR